MRFKGYIINEDRSKSISEQQLISGVQKDCKKMLVAMKKKNTRLYRGNYNGQMFSYIEPKKSIRKSANTTNLYTLVIDNHPKWKSYPKRSQSIVCTTDNQTASNYGDTYIVIPKDGATYGVCPENDMWSSFQKTLSDMWLDEMNNDIWYLAEKLGVDPMDLYTESYRTLVMFLTELDKGIMERDIKIQFELPWSKNRYDNDMLKMIQEILDPVANKFKLIKDPGQLPKDGASHEVWTDQPSYMVREDWMQQQGYDIILGGK